MRIVRRKNGEKESSYLWRCGAAYYGAAGGLIVGGISAAALLGVFRCTGVPFGSDAAGLSLVAGALISSPLLAAWWSGRIAVPPWDD